MRDCALLKSELYCILLYHTLCYIPLYKCNLLYSKKLYEKRYSKKEILLRNFSFLLSYCETKLPNQNSPKKEITALSCIILITTTVRKHSQVSQ